MFEQFISHNEARLWTITSGGGLPIMLCNGGPGCCDYLEPVAELLTDIARVSRFEQRGCGRSSATPPYDVATCIADLEAIREAFGYEQWVIGGHSWGVDLALGYGLAHPGRVKAIIGISGGRIVNDREWSKIYKRNRVERGEPLPDYAYPPNMEVNRLVNSSWRAYIQCPNLLRELANLAVPTLFVFGSQDIRPAWPTQQIANLLPNAQFHLIEGADHHPWMTHEAELKNVLQTFVRSLMS